MGNIESEDMFLGDFFGEPQIEFPPIYLPLLITEPKVFILARNIGSLNSIQIVDHQIVNPMVPSDPEIEISLPESL